MKIQNVTIFGILSKLASNWRRHEKLRIGRKIVKHGGAVVQNGPFKGLELCPSLDLVTNLPKLVGSYEKELHPIIAGVIKSSVSTIIDIGTAEGYYAVGMAKVMPNARVIGFEIDDKQRTRCRSAAQLNGVESRLELLGLCDNSSLRRFDLSGVFLLVDCEGCELDILAGDIVSKLKDSILLIELHDALRPGCGRLLTERFMPTHNMSFTSSTPRAVNSASIAGLSQQEMVLAVEEPRTGIQEWVLMWPKGTNFPPS